MNRPSTQPIAVAVLGDYPALRAGLRALLDGADAIEVVTDSALEGLTSLAPFTAIDIAVVDAGDRPTEWLEAVATFLPTTPAVIVLAHPRDALLSDSPTGAPRAWLLRDTDGPALAAAVRALAQGLVVLDPAVAAVIAATTNPRLDPGAAGGEPLTDREYDVLRLMAVGLGNKAIARDLGISENTVKFHVSAIFAKLGASARTEAVTLALRRGLLAL